MRAEEERKCAKCGASCVGLICSSCAEKENEADNKADEQPKPEPAPSDPG